MNKFIKNSVLTFIVINLLLIGCLAKASNYPLEIIQPRGGLNTNNRFYRAYPGFVYDVRLAVIGGGYPFTYSLTTAPPGMTINSSTGEITWSNPTVSGSPHSVTAKVKDAENTEVTVSWTITVTTTDFVFLDIINGKSIADGGTGTLANPWKTLDDLWEGGSNGQFAYFRAGTYTVPSTHQGGNGYMTFSLRPNVWLAYPGESVVLDQTNGYIYIGVTPDSTYIGGLEVINITNKGFMVGGDANNITFYKNTFHEHTGSIGANPGAIWMPLEAGTGLYWSFQDNIAYNVTNACWILSESRAKKVVVEDNTLHDFSSGAGTHPIFLKACNQMWFIRHNHIYNSAYDGLLLFGGGGSGNPATQDIEVSYNLVQMTSNSAIQVNNVGPPTYTGVIYVFRNTLVGVANVYVDNNSIGPLNFYNNVIINSSSATDHINCYDDPGYNNPCSYPARLVKTDNLSGTSSDNIVDSSGNLTSAYSSYLGTHGRQLASAPSAPPPQPPGAPSAPKGLRIE